MVAEPSYAARRPAPRRRPPDPGGSAVPGGHLPDQLVDTLDKALPPPAQVDGPPARRLGAGARARTPARHGQDLRLRRGRRALASARPRSAVKDVAAELDLEHSTVSRLLGEVEDDGLVTRGVDPADRGVRRWRSPPSVARWSPTPPRCRGSSPASCSPSGRARTSRSSPGLMTRLAETVHARLDALPELAIAEFCRSAPGGTGPGPTRRSTGDYSPTRAASLRSTSRPSSSACARAGSARARSASASRTTRIASAARSSPCARASRPAVGCGPRRRGCAGRAQLAVDQRARRLVLGLGTETPSSASATSGSRDAALAQLVARARDAPARGRRAGSARRPRRTPRRRRGARPRAGRAPSAATARSTPRRASTEASWRAGARGEA